MNTKSYTARDTLSTIIWALRRKNIDVLKECHQILVAHNDEKMLLMLNVKDYEKYHELLQLTSVEQEVKGRN